VGFESIGAISQCMEALNLDSNAERSHTARARFANLRDRKLSGSIVVTFNSNWHSGDGPFLEFGEEIKSFGIRYTQFKPQWLKITWSPQALELAITHEDYGFTLQFT
jgi:hypothetical protein